MRYAAVLLIALSGACKFDPLKGFDPFEGLGPHIELTTVTVSPTVVRAGSQFVASASATYGNCEFVGITVNYAGQYADQPGTAFQSSFSAVLGQTAVRFDAYCSATGNSTPIPAPSKYVYIDVAPAP